MSIAAAALASEPLPDPLDVFETGFEASLRSEPNQREHFIRRWKRGSTNRANVSAVLRVRWRVKPPGVGTYLVVLTRAGTRDLDDDNCPVSLKAVRDGVTDYLGFASDADPRLAFRYEQRKALRVALTVRIERYADPDPALRYDAARLAGRLRARAASVDTAGPCPPSPTVAPARSARSPSPRAKRPGRTG